MTDTLCHKRMEMLKVNYNF